MYILETLFNRPGPIGWSHLQQPPLSRRMFESVKDLFKSKPVEIVYSLTDEQYRRYIFDMVSS